MVAASSPIQCHIGTVPLSSAPSMSCSGVELLGVEADRADVVAPAGGLVALHQVGQRRAALAGDADRDAVEGEPDGLLGEEHQRRAAGLGGADGDQERDGDLLGVLEPGGQADRRLCLAMAASSSCVRDGSGGTRR